jgi:hypothetical protein
MRGTATTVTALFICGYATFAAAGDKSLANRAGAIGAGDSKSISLSASPTQSIDDQVLNPADANVDIQVGPHALSVSSYGVLGHMQSLANAPGRVTLGDIPDGATRIDLRAHSGDYAVRNNLHSSLLAMP